MFDVLEKLDGLSGLRNRLRELAAEKDEFSGIPLPVEGEELIIEPSHPLYKVIGLEAKREEIDRENAASGIKVRNFFYSTRYRCDVYVVEDVDGKVRRVLQPAANHLDFDLRTLGCADVWGLEQESTALQLLGTLVNHRKFKNYILTGTFLESSKRSGVMYLFRRLKPTVALRLDPVKNQTRILAALCMHPIAYYQYSWAGAMCPTDDLIAHLQLMRGDEPFFWKRCSQHPGHRPEAGI